MLLKDLADLEEFLEGAWQVLGHPGHLLGSADSGNHILTLSIDQVLTVKNILARGRIAREGHSRPGVSARIPEDHGLHVHGSPPLHRDPVFLAIDLGPVIVPGIKDRVDRAMQLLHGILRKSPAGPLSDQLLELCNDPAKVRLLQSRIVLNPCLGLGLVEDNLIGIVMLVGVCLYSHHHTAVHLQEASIAVPGKLCVTCPGRESLRHLVVDPEIQHRIHHPRH